ncbi:MAG: gamma-glutamyltransferase [Gemmatimonadetes bacterium]|nr:gamma-glutamyltransferase [Gemmatimonadota bacterium]
MRTFDLVHLVPALVLALIAIGCGPAGSQTADRDAGGVSLPPWNRPDVMGTAGAVSSDHPLATAAGYDVLRRGGNATDAAVTMAAVLAIVRPHMSGVGGDAFALFFDSRAGEVTGLNGSGRAGRLATLDLFRQLGHSKIPETGALSVSVPGVVGAWEEALKRFGTISLAEALAPAIRYAEEGFPVSSRLHQDIVGAGEALNEAGRALYLAGGAAPAVGTLLRNPALARTLTQIARGGAEVFYRGPIGARLATFIEREGGYLRRADFEEHRSEWVEPLAGDYLGHRVFAMPPNSQGLVQLQQMTMAEAFDLRAVGHNSADYLHTLIEIKKLAFADLDRWVGDPAFAEIPVAALLDPGYLRRRAALVSPDSAALRVDPGVGEQAADAQPRSRGQAHPGSRTGQSHADGELAGLGDTVYLTAVDRWGNAVSWIQSLFESFGSGLVEPETGIVLHNRGALFRLDPNHPNRLEPGKRPFHTLSPLLALRDGRLAMTLGTPGGDSQSQSLLQVFNNLVLFGMTPQEAVEAPRFRSYGGRRLDIEDRIPVEVRRSLAERGHELRVVSGWTATFGGAQMIYVHPESGVLIVAADPRREAYAVAY